MKRFLVFAYDCYYPCGAKGDVHGDYDSLDEAIANLPKDADFADVLDLEKREWVADLVFENGGWRSK